VTVVFEPATSGTAVVVTAAIAGLAVIVVIPTELSAIARIATRAQGFFAIFGRIPLVCLKDPKMYDPN
jgi:hypothetical protein